MSFALLASKLAMRPDPSVLILTFFAYSFLGYVMECIVLSAEKRQVVVNRGFTSHLPFCIIYGAGAMIGFIILSPLREAPLLLYLVGALAATGFEFTVGMTQQKLFGDFWWDYSKKPFNFKGMLCLESTIFWGFVALAVVKLHIMLVDLISRLPRPFAPAAAVLLLGAYLVDFGLSAHQARQRKHIEEQAALEAYEYESRAS